MAPAVAGMLNARSESRRHQLGVGIDPRRKRRSTGGGRAAPRPDARGSSRSRPMLAGTGAFTATDQPARAVVTLQVTKVFCTRRERNM
jgi:hypothetical protein